MKQRYNALKERGKTANQAYIAIGNRMIRLAFSMIRNHTLYRTDHENYVLKNVLTSKLRSAYVKRFYEKHVLPELQKTA
nr:hypothetical protein [Fredinandcohnia onubensis]